MLDSHIDSVRQQNLYQNKERYDLHLIFLNIIWTSDSTDQ